MAKLQDREAMRLARHMTLLFSFVAVTSIRMKPARYASMAGAVQ